MATPFSGAGCRVSEFDFSCDKIEWWKEAAVSEREGSQQGGMPSPVLQPDPTHTPTQHRHISQQRRPQVHVGWPSLQKEASRVHHQPLTAGAQRQGLVTMSVAHKRLVTFELATWAEEEE